MVACTLSRIEGKAMSNGARYRGRPKTPFPHVKAEWAGDRPLDKRFNPVVLTPRNRAYVIRNAA